MGLIARQLEASEIPTLSMTSAWSITRSVNPPRAAFVDYPLGHTTGKPDRPELQREILRAALRALEQLDQPGELVDLGLAWSEDDGDDSWKDLVMRPGPDGSGDNRGERHPEPQYQSEDDRRAAEEAESCPTCIFV